MRLEILSTVGATLILQASFGSAQHHGGSLERRHAHHSRPQSSSSLAAREGDIMIKRGGQCQFPSNAGLVAVTPDKQNAGWAMSPDQPCMPGHFCPYACPPGQMMAQWDPKATSYTYPLSMVSYSSLFHELWLHVLQLMHTIEWRTLLR